MSKRREIERNAGAFLGLGVTPIPAPANALHVGPGKPGPGDDWQFPTGPLDEVVPEDEGLTPDAASTEPVRPARTVFLPDGPSRKP